MRRKGLLMDGISSWLSYVIKNSDNLLEASLQHARIVLVVILIATVFSVGLGIVVQRFPTARAVALSIAGIFLTIMGIGNPPAMLALFLYAILPILRNTVTGLEEVDPAVVESARGMGMGTGRQLVRVKLPLAWPVIMAGVRMSSLLVVGVAAIAVLVGGDGLGSFIQGGLTRLGLPGSVEAVLVGTVFTVALGLTLDLVFGFVQRLTTSSGLRN